MKPRVCIPYGHGFNSERETLYAWREAGADPELVLFSEMRSGEKKLRDYQILEIPPGFSFGDYLGAGVVAAVMLKTIFGEDLNQFRKDGKPILGICNGFQILTEMGHPIIDGDDSKKATLAANESGQFYNGWVRLRINPASPCIFTRGMRELDVPVRHGEGRYVPKDEEITKKLVEKDLIVAQYCDQNGNTSVGYPHNPNGSWMGVAAVTDETGLTLGMMPHPDGHLIKYVHPRWEELASSDEKAEGLKIFRNAVEHCIRHS